MVSLDYPMASVIRFSIIVAAQTLSGHSIIHFASKSSESFPPTNSGNS